MKTNSQKKKLRVFSGRFSCVFCRSSRHIMGRLSRAAVSALVAVQATHARANAMSRASVHVASDLSPVVGGGNVPLGGISPLQPAPLVAGGYQTPMRPDSFAKSSDSPSWLRTALEVTAAISESVARAVLPNGGAPGAMGEQYGSYPYQPRGAPRRIGSPPPPRPSASISSSMLTTPTSRITRSRGGKTGYGNGLDEQLGGPPSIMDGSGNDRSSVSFSALDRSVQRRQGSQETAGRHDGGQLSREMTTAVAEVVREAMADALPSRAAPHGPNDRGSMGGGFTDGHQSGVDSGSQSRHDNSYRGSMSDGSDDERSRLSGDGYRGGMSDGFDDDGESDYLEHDYDNSNSNRWDTVNRGFCGRAGMHVMQQSDHHRRELAERRRKREMSMSNMAVVTATAGQVKNRKVDRILQRVAERAEQRDHYEDDARQLALMERQRRMRDSIASEADQRFESGSSALAVQDSMRRRERREVTSHDEISHDGPLRGMYWQPLGAQPGGAQPGMMPRHGPGAQPGMMPQPGAQPGMVQPGMPPAPGAQSGPKYTR